VARRSGQFRRIKHTAAVDLTIEGSVPKARRASFERMLRMAMRELSLESLRVRIVRDDNELPEGLLAGAGTEGIWLRHETLLDDGVVVASVALEEVAHYKVLTLGGRREWTEHLRRSLGGGVLRRVVCLDSATAVGRRR